MISLAIKTRYAYSSGISSRIITILQTFSFKTVLGLEVIEIKISS